jgi:alpha-mannosidase
VLDAYLSYWRSDDNFEIEGFLLHHLEEACRTIGPQLNSREEAREAAARAQRILRRKVFESKAYRHKGRLNICAHSHLDIIYLWPIKETFRKNCRTATNMLSLIREYPVSKLAVKIETK